MIEGTNKWFIVYDNGDVFDISLNRFKSKIKHYKGYIKYSFTINGKDKKLFAHRIVLETFCPVENMENLQVNHIDGDKTNNNLSNLEWCTQSENQKHAFKNGLLSRSGVKNSQAKLNESQVIEIANMLKNHVSYNTISKIFNISKSTISKIRSKSLWKDVLKNFDFS